MIYLKPLRLFLGTALARAWAGLDRERALRAATLLVPLGFALYALRLGQDDNWDLHNYHLYNPYALLHGKIGLDLAPAQWQSYFNPALDLLYYGLATRLPAPAVGAVMGYLHGLNFVLLLALGRQAWRECEPGAPAARRGALLLALAGCLGAGFLLELGNTMGDNLTSLAVLGALLLVLRQQPALARGGARGAAMAALAGLAMGLGTGLKLTNAGYALALCLALFALPGGLRVGLRAAFCFGLGVLAGIAVSAGPWYWKMWQVFGNPLFPQFNNWFHAPLAAAIGIGDTGWQPKGWIEKVLWPFIFTLDPRRVIELPLKQLIWPMLYLAFLALAAAALRARLRAGAAAAAPAPGNRLLLSFFALSYLIWLNLFGIYRYLVPLELLAPLVFWLLLRRLTTAPRARRIGAWALLLAAGAVFPLSNWGHAHWTRDAFRVELPAIADPAASMVFTVHGDPPMGWLVPFFPDALAFVALGSGFPESQGYLDRVAAMMARRGALYVMLEADRQRGQERSPEQERLAQEHERGALEKARALLLRYGLELDDASCRSYPAWTGSNPWPYRFCGVRRR